MHILLPIHRQLPFLNQQKGENDSRNYFMINLHETNVAELGFELATHVSEILWPSQPNGVM